MLLLLYCCFTYVKIFFSFGRCSIHRRRNSPTCPRGNATCSRKRKTSSNPKPDWITAAFPFCGGEPLKPLPAGVSFYFESLPAQWFLWLEESPNSGAFYWLKKACTTCITIAVTHCRVAVVTSQVGSLLLQCIDYFVLSAAQCALQRTHGTHLRTLGTCHEGNTFRKNTV